MHAALRLPIALCALLAVGAVGAVHAQPYERQSGADLQDCVAALESQGGGWCEIRVSDRDPSISSVFPPMNRRLRMNTGPKSVLLAWNSAAFDEDDLLMYFHGGGHGDYGGNEVYEFDLRAGAWSRLTDPSPLDHIYLRSAKAGAKKYHYCWITDLSHVPGAAHTYDGIQFSKATRTIFLVMTSAADGSCFEEKVGVLDDDPRLIPHRSGIYEFNPSRKDERNGLAPLTWRLVWPDAKRLGYPRFLEFPDGRMLVGNRASMNLFDPLTGHVGKGLWAEPDAGDGIAVYHPLGLALMLKKSRLVIRDLAAKQDRTIGVPEGHGKSMAIDRNGIVFSWNGRSLISILDVTRPDPKWVQYDWSQEGGPQQGDRYRVYGKWRYVPQHDVFVGLSHPATGVWIYKHPATMPTR